MYHHVYALSIRYAIAVVLSMIPIVNAVCVHCSDNIDGCRGGTDCPLITGTAANAAIIAGASTGLVVLTHLLPLKFLRVFDACKGPRYTGGGYVSACGRYGFWRYGTSAARKLIDEIEGDTFDGAVEEMAGHYRRCMVPSRIDNSSFQRSQVKGRSRAPRLNDLMKKLFVRQIQGEFVLSSTWISSEDNELADDLSRDREVTFLQRAVASGFWHLDVVPLRHPQAGRTRTFAVAVDPLGPARDVFPGHGRAAAEEPALASDVAGDEDEGPVLEGNHEPRSCLRLHGAGGVTRFSDSVPHPHATLTEGLPAELLTDLEDVLDNRLAASSYRSVGSGMVRWRDVAEKYGWPTIIRTHDPTRGAKIVALVLHMVHDTELVWSSINKCLGRAAMDAVAAPGGPCARG